MLSSAVPFPVFWVTIHQYHILIQLEKVSSFPTQIGHTTNLINITKIGTHWTSPLCNQFLSGQAGNHWHLVGDYCYCYRHFPRWQLDPSDSASEANQDCCRLINRSIMSNCSSFPKQVSKHSHQHHPSKRTTTLTTCQMFGDLFLFGLVWQYFSIQTRYNKGRFKDMATYLQQ